MTRQMISLQVPAEMAGRLSVIAQQFGISRSDVVRMAINEFIDADDMRRYEAEHRFDPEPTFEEVMRDGKP